MKKNVLKTISILLLLVFILVNNTSKAATYVFDFYKQGGVIRGQNTGDSWEITGGQGGVAGGIYNDDHVIDGCTSHLETTFSTDKLNYKIGEKVYPVLNVFTRENTCGLSIFGNGLYSSYDSNSSIVLLSSPLSLDYFNISDTYEVGGGEDVTPFGKYKLETFGTPVYSSYRSNYPLVLTDSAIPNSSTNKSDLLLLYGKPILKNSRIQEIEVENETLYVNREKYSTPYRMPSGSIPYKSIDDTILNEYYSNLSAEDQTQPFTTTFNVIESNPSPKIFVR